jgi:hypothetical protein
MTPVTVPTVNRELGNGYLGSSVDKRLKIDKPLGAVYLSTEPRPIKVADLAPSETLRADEIRIETATTGKVNAVVAVMSIFILKNVSFGELISGMRSLLTKRRKVLISPRKIPIDQETFPQ